MVKKNENINEFVDSKLREYALYTIFNRAIASFEDGLKPVQRKILYTAIKKGLLKKEMKTIGFIGEIISFTHYHHGDTSLANAIEKLAADYIPVNNYPLMKGDGFGSRVNPFAASPRYTFVELSEHFKETYNIDIDLLDYIKDNKELLVKNDEENCYDYFLPLLPQILFNGAKGIATGFSINIYPRNLKELKSFALKIIQGKKPKTKLLPYFKGFKGTISYNKTENKFEYEIPFERINDKKIIINEISPFIKTEKFKKILMDLKEKNIIKKYKDETKKEYKFIIEFNEKISDDSVNNYFKLKSTFATDEINLIKDGSKLVSYNTIEEYIYDFVSWRMKKYRERKDFIITKLNEKLSKKILELKYISEVNKLDKNKLTRTKLKSIINKIKGTELQESLLRIPILSFTKDEITDKIKIVKELKLEIQKIKNKDFIEDYIKELKSINA